jgi:hypothetical protein
MTIIVVAIIIVLLLLIFFFQVAPKYTGHLLVIFLLVLGFMCTEKWITHDAAEFENRFWSFIAFLLTSSSFLTCNDSPVYFPDDLKVYAWFIVIVLTFIAHNYDRHIQRIFLTKETNILRRIRSADFAQENRVNAKLYLVELKKNINAIDMYWMSSTFLNLFFLPSVLYAENKIIQIFTDSNKSELNLILYQCKLPLILYKMKDHKFANRFNRSILLELLAQDRIHELNVPCKAILLDALQRLKLSAHPKNEFYVKNIFLATKGIELSELKCLTDNKGDFNSMHKLIYYDLRNTGVREAILHHIQKEANVMNAHHLIRSKHSKKLETFAWMKIVSDIDDTLSCSGGSWPKGMDLSYPSKAIYPGVIAFYRELDLGTAGEKDEWDANTRIGNLVLLSARPHVYKDVSESFTYDKFRILQQQRGLHTSPTLLAGSLDSGGKFMVNLDSEPLAVKKYENFRNFLQIYPEFKCVFIGDNGQGDVRTTELMLEDDKTCSNLTRSYVHIVQPLSKTYVKNSLYRKKSNYLSSSSAPSSLKSHSSSWSAATTNLLPNASSNNLLNMKRSRICFFLSYIDAAVDAYENKLIRLTGLRRTMVESVVDFMQMKETIWKMDNPYDESCLLQSDTKILLYPWKLVKIEEKTSKTLTPISSANSLKAPRSPSIEKRKSFTTTAVKVSANSALLLSKAATNLASSTTTTLLSLPAIHLPSLRPSVKTSLHTPVPPAILDPQSEEMKAKEEIVSSANEHLESLMNPPNLNRSNSDESDNPMVQHVRQDKMIFFNNSAIQSKNGFVKREMRIRELNASLVKGNEILLKNGADKVGLVEFPQIYKNGQIVSTAFGMGKIQSFRSTDGIYEVYVGKGVIEEGEGEVKKPSSKPTTPRDPEPAVLSRPEAKPTLTKIYVAGMYLYVH